MNALHPLSLLGVLTALAAAQSIDLSGQWRFALDPQDSGVHSRPEQWRFPATIRLPGILTAQGFGETPSFKTQWTGDGWRYPQMFKEWQADANFKFPFFLQPPKHPAFSAFVTDFHSNWQWWEIQQNAQPFILTELPAVKPIVQVIDDWFTNRKLGYVFEARVGTGKLLACSADLTNNLGRRPAARQLLVSLLEYMGDTRFAPSAALTPAAMEGLINP